MPRLSDSGTVIELDLHGAPLHEAMSLLERTLDLAGARGRTALDVIHGSSTSVDGHRRTIRSEVLRFLEQGGHPDVASFLPGSDKTRIALPLGRTSDPSRLSLLDVY